MEYRRISQFAFTIFIFYLLQLNSAAKLIKRQANDLSTEISNKKIVCYYTNWSPYREDIGKFNVSDIDPSLCTHVMYAYAIPNLEEGIMSYDSFQDLTNNGYLEFTNLKQTYKDVKFILSIGGWNEGSERFSVIVSTEEMRKNFIEKSIEFLKKYNFDGLDLVWNYPTHRDGGKPEDKVNYGLLVKELREAFEKEAEQTGNPIFILSMEVPGSAEYIDSYDIPIINKYLDFFNVVTYDFHMAFEPTVQHHSPLYPLQEEIDTNSSNLQLNVDWAINQYLNRGASPSKIHLSIPGFGRLFRLADPTKNDIGDEAEGPGNPAPYTDEAGYIALYELCTKIKEDNWTVVYKNTTAMGPYAFKDNQWVSYDDVSIVEKKAQYSIDKGLGGLTFWELSIDDFAGVCNGRKNLLVQTGRDYFLNEKNYRENINSAIEKTDSMTIKEIMEMTINETNGVTHLSHGSKPVKRDEDKGETTNEDIALNEIPNKVVKEDKQVDTNNVKITNENTNPDDGIINWLIIRGATNHVNVSQLINIVFNN